MITPEMSAALLAACCSGDPSERATGYQRLGGLLLPVARRKIRSDPSFGSVADDPRLEHVADDCTQEALLKVWNQLQAGRGPDKPAAFVGWSMVIVTRKVQDELRRLRAGPPTRRSSRVPFARLDRLDDPGPDGRTHMDGLPDPAGLDPADGERAMDIVSLASMIGASGRISERSRTVILLGFLDDWSDSDLADRLHIAKDYVQYCRHHDLVRLRTHRPLMDRLAALYPRGGGQQGTGALVRPR